MTTRKTTRKRTTRRSRKSAWKPGWYRQMEIRTRHMEQVAAFWCGLVVKCTVYGAAAIVSVYVVLAVYL